MSDVKEAFDEDLIPYPESTDRVEVAVFCTKTGNIKQVVGCCLMDGHRQHAAFPDHDYIETTGETVSPHDHVVDLATRTVVPRTILSPRDRRHKEHEFEAAHLAAAPSLEEIIAALCGDDLAKAKDLAKARVDMKAKYDGLVQAVRAAQTRDELSKITW